MTLARADLLGVGLLVALLLALALGAQSRRLERLRRALGRGAERMLPPAPGRGAARLACTLLASGALALAAAGPSPRTPDEPAPPAPIDAMVVVDVSLSMTAADVGPSRLERARTAIAEIADALPQARIGLVVFADWPYTLLPPTDDLDVVRWFARALEAEAVPARHQGTTLALAIAEAQRALDARPLAESRRAVIILSDGDAHDGAEAAVDAARTAAAAGITVWTGGLGTVRGAELGSAVEPVVDLRGARVASSLDEDLLRTVASAGGGRFEDVSTMGRAGELAAALGATASEAPPPPDPVLWLTLLALPLLLWDGALDRGRGLPRRRPHRAAASDR